MMKSDRTDSNRHDAPAARNSHASSRHHLARKPSLKARQPQPRSRILDDLAFAITLLQREEPLLQRRFGLGWADVASIVEDEAARRATSTTAIARLLVAGLRVDEARGLEAAAPGRGE